MVQDDSAVSLDTITCESGQFGFFQKRLFLINTLIQSACVSVLLYTCACMPEVDETDGNETGNGQTFVISPNGYHYDNTDREYKDSNKTADSTNHHLNFQDHTATLVVTLDIVYQNISTVASTLVKNLTQNSFTDNSLIEQNNTFQRIFDKLKGNMHSATSSMTNILSNVAIVPPTISGHVPSSTNTELTSTTDLRQSDLNVGKFVSMLTDNVKRLKNEISHSTNFSLEKSLKVYSVGGFSDVSSERYRGLTSHKGTFIQSEYVACSTVGTEVVSSSNVTQHGSTMVVEATPAFGLLRLDLRRTEMLRDLSFEELVQVTSYAQAGGVILGALTGSMMADIFGRKRLLFLFLSGMLIVHCMVALSISWMMFIFLRTVAVGCAGATLVISLVTVIESVGPDWRDVCTCSCMWTMGAILLSLETVATAHWRWLAVLSGGICLPLIATYLTSMESLKWLHCQHRFTEAEWGFREVMTVNSAAVPDIVALLDQSRGYVVNNMHMKRFTFLDLFHSLDSTKWTLTLIYTCAISSTVYFCLLLRVKEITSFSYFNGFLPFVLDLPLTWSVIVMNRCLGRRWCLFLYSVASGFALLWILILHLTGNADILPSLVTGLALFGKIGVTASMSLILILATEIYPTVTRCMGVAVAVAAGSVGSMLVNALAFLEQYHYTVPFVAYGAMMSSVGIVGLMFPETIKQPLKNVQQCRHRKIPLMEGARLVGRPPSLWETV